MTYKERRLWLQSGRAELFLTVVRHIWHLETLPAVSLVGPELYPEPLGAGGESDGTLVRLTRLVSGHGVGQSCEAKDCNTIVAAKLKVLTALRRSVRTHSFFS